MQRHEERIKKGMSHCCPTCGGKLNLDEDNLRIDLGTNNVMGYGVAIKLPPRHAEIVSVLLEKFPAAVGQYVLIEKIWPNQEISEHLLSTTLWYTRRNLEKIGWSIRNEYGQGYRLIKKNVKPKQFQNVGWASNK